MTPEEIVRSRYPQAESQHHDAVYQYGQRDPIQPEGWVIYASGGLGVTVLGKGNSEEEAWKNAASSVQ